MRLVAAPQLPSSQGSGTLVPSAQWCPAKHGSHAVAPVAGAWVPAAHAVHEPCPFSPLKVPALHGVAFLAPAGQKVPAMQREQSSSLGMPDEAPSLPAGQSCAVLAPCTQKAPSSQARHAVAL